MPCANRTTNTDISYVRCPVLKNHFGKSTARILQQLHYWLSHENLSYGIIHDNRQWIRNSYNQWHQQIKKMNHDLAVITIRRAFSELEKKSIVLSHCFDDHKNYIGGNQVKSYTIDYDKLESLVGDLSKTLITRPRSIKDQKLGLKTQAQDRAGNISSLNEVSVQTDAQNVHQKRTSSPDQMNTPPDQMSISLNRYISNKHSNKLSLFKVLQHNEKTQQCFVNNETVQPGKPAERDKINIVEDMISLWNEIIEQTPNKISLTPKRSQHLNTAFKQFFNSDLSDWEAFCCKIASSKFLMGEVKDFKANLDWSIRFETIQRILEGGYSFGDRVVKYIPRLKTADVNPRIDLLTTPLEADSHIKSETKQESPEALAIRHRIHQSVGNAIYQSWFEKTEIVLEHKDTNKNQATLYVSTRFIAERLRIHYRDIVETYFDAIRVGEPQKIYMMTETASIQDDTITTPMMSTPEEQPSEIIQQTNPELIHQVQMDTASDPFGVIDNVEEYQIDRPDAANDQHVNQIREKPHNISCFKSVVTHIEKGGGLRSIFSKQVRNEPRSTEQLKQPGHFYDKHEVCKDTEKDKFQEVSTSSPPLYINSNRRVEIKVMNLLARKPIFKNTENIPAPMHYETENKKGVSRICCGIEMSPRLG